MMMIGMDDEGRTQVLTISSPSHPRPWCSPREAFLLLVAMVAVLALVTTLSQPLHTYTWRFGPSDPQVRVDSDATSQAADTSSVPNATTPSPSPIPSPSVVPSTQGGGGGGGGSAQVPDSLHIPWNSKGASLPSLADVMKRFVEKHPGIASRALSHAEMLEYESLLVPYIDEEPPAAIRVKHRPTPLDAQLDCKNADWAHVLTGERRKTPVKAFDFIMFNAELDILEMRLYELNDTVERFVILESTRTHHGIFKPLFFERHLERFRDFLPKIIHLVVDEATIAQFTKSGDPGWNIERAGRQFVWEGFAKAYGEDKVGEEDILIHGDCDEMPSGLSVHHLRHCVTRKMPLGSNAIFYQGNSRIAFQGDWPPTHPSGFSYSLRYPEYFNKKHVKQHQPPGFPRNSHGNNGNIPGGMHMTYYQRMAVLLWKMVSIVEGNRIHSDTVDLRAFQRKMHEGTITWWGRGRMVSVDKLPPIYKKPLFLPWVAEHNRDRFPPFFNVDPPL